jgi:aromatic aminotransferase
LQKVLKDNEPIPKLVSVVNPRNPSRAFIPRPMFEKISDLCKNAGAWLVVDNAYEYFMYDAMEHYCLEDTHMVNLFS